MDLFCHNMPVIQETNKEPFQIFSMWIHQILFCVQALVIHGFQTICSVLYDYIVVLHCHISYQTTQSTWYSEE